MAEEVKGFANLMRYCNTLEDYNQKKADGKVTDDVLVIVLEDKVIKFKGYTFSLSGEGGGGGGECVDDSLIRTLYIAYEEGETLTEEQMAYNAETYRMLADGLTPIVVFGGLICTVVATGGDENDGYADIFFKRDGDSYLAAISLLLKSDGSVELGEERYAPKLAILTNQEHAQFFFENYQVFTEMKGVFLVSANVSGMALAEVDFIGSENGFPYVEYNLHDKRFRVEFNADYTIKEGVEITPAGGGGSIDPELLEGFIPLSRDFSDDFNNDFAR